MAITKPRRAGTAGTISRLFSSKTFSKSQGAPKSSKATKTRPPPPPPAPASRTATRKSKRGQASIAYHEIIGQYRTEITSSQGKECGVFSLEVSISNQLAAAAATADDDDDDGGELTLLPAVFDELFAGEQEFYDEQLALILYLWGRAHGETLKLGVVVEGLEPFVLPLPVIEGEAAPAPAPEAEEGEENGGTTIWIHNDNAQVIMGRECNHYSGITILASVPPTT